MRMTSWTHLIEARSFLADFSLGILEEVSRYGAAQIITALSPGHSDIIKVSSMFINRDRKSFEFCRNFFNFAQSFGTVEVSIRVQAFRDTLYREIQPVQIFMNDRLIRLTWDAQIFRYFLSEIRPPLLQENSCNSAHEQTPLSNHTRHYVLRNF
jgi:hypothetical protein